jgi:hypothetical protein
VSKYHKVKEDPDGTALSQFDMKAHNEQRHYERDTGNEFAYVPPGSNVALQFYSKVKDESPSRTHHVIDQVGWTLVQDHYTFGVKVFAKYERKEGRLTLFVEDEDGMTTIATYER